MQQYHTFYEINGITYVHVKTANSKKEAQRHLKSFERGAKIIGTWERDKQPPSTWGPNGWVICETGEVTP